MSCKFCTFNEFTDIAKITSSTRRTRYMTIRDGGEIMSALHLLKASIHQDLYTKEVFLHIDGDDEINIKLNYCPWCGRKFYYE